MATTQTFTPTTPAAAPSTRGKRAGLVLSGLAGLFLLFDGVTHVLDVEQVRTAMQDLGYPGGASLVIGVLELVSLACYLIPRTAPLGAVLLSAYLGGAMSAQLRVEAPVFSTMLFPVYVALLMWAGLWLRDSRVRALLPARKA